MQGLNCPVGNRLLNREWCNSSGTHARCLVQFCVQGVGTSRKKSEAPAPRIRCRESVGARDANPVDPLLVGALVVGGSLARLVDATCLGSKNRDADTLTGFDVVRIVQRGVELMNLA
jgi:hypothetical protein